MLHNNDQKTIFTLNEAVVKNDFIWGWRALIYVWLMER